MTIAIICGGRYHEPFPAAHVAWLDRLHEQLVFSGIVEGGGQRYDKDRRLWLGADYHARKWAESRGIDTVTFWANWKKYGKSAGPRRNTRPAAYLTMMRETYGEKLAGGGFDGGSGTRDMLEK